MVNCILVHVLIKENQHIDPKALYKYSNTYRYIDLSEINSSSAFNDQLYGEKDGM
jgi:hypothetical protein